jgi:hypothetical protein
MAHSFLKDEKTGARICSSCGDERGFDPERPCPFAQQAPAGDPTSNIH